jgi:hypothetical protein
VEVEIGTKRMRMVNFTSWPLYPSRERALITHWIGGWIDLRAGLESAAKGKNPFKSPAREANPGNMNRYGKNTTSSSSSSSTTTTTWF